MTAPEVPTRRADWPRCVMPEILDSLPADDARAVRSRRDLRMINRIMGSLSLLLRGLDVAAQSGPCRLVELGSGDGSLMLRLARSRARRWRDTSVVLLDKEPAVDDETLAAIRSLSWSVDIVAADVLDWLDNDPGDGDAIVFANLFVHHFEGDRLVRLLEGVARHARLFVCCEPRRSRLALTGSHLLGIIGCSAVTRHDAVVSVHAGFHDRELTALWSANPVTKWRLDESAAGAFSHLFVAERAR